MDLVLQFSNMFSKLKKKSVQSPIMYNILIKFLNEGIMPDQIKIAIVLSVYKSGNIKCSLVI